LKKKTVTLRRGKEEKILKKYRPLIALDVGEREVIEWLTTGVQLLASLSGH
jgi:hypothetical protein